MASNSAYALAFHRGLGNVLYPASSIPINKYVNAGSIAAFADIAYAKPNFAIVANGADTSALSKWVNEFFPSARAQSPQSVSHEKSKYHGGEERIAHGSGNAMVIAFPGSSSFTGGSYKPEISILATLLGGQTSIKWSPGFSLLSKAAAKYPGASISTKSEIFSDAGLLTISLSGAAGDMRKASGEVVDAIKAIASGVGKEEFTKAKALAKFKELEFGQNISAGIELTGSGLVHGDKAYQIDEVAQKVDSVTEEQVKSVSDLMLSINHPKLIFHSRLLRLFWRARRRCRQWVICMLCPSRRRLASRYRKYEAFSDVEYTANQSRSAIPNITVISNPYPFCFVQWWTGL